MSGLADEILQLTTERGGDSYFGEPVSQLEHALQTAWLASQAESAPAMVPAQTGCSRPVNSVGAVAAEPRPI
jgi:predicted HD phosphohydrolase